MNIEPGWLGPAPADSSTRPLAYLVAVEYEDAVDCAKQSWGDNTG